VSARLQVDVTSILLDEAVRRSTQQKLNTQLLEDGALDGTAENSLCAAPATRSQGPVLAQVIAKLSCCKLSKGEPVRVESALQTCSPLNLLLWAFFKKHDEIPMPHLISWGEDFASPSLCQCKEHNVTMVTLSTRADHAGDPLPGILPPGQEGALSQESSSAANPRGAMLPSKADEGSETAVKASHRSSDGADVAAVERPPPPCWRTLKPMHYDAILMLEGARRCPRGLPTVAFTTPGYEANVGYTCGAILCRTAGLTQHTD
jgi:hypothetical protein